MHAMGSEVEEPTVTSKKQDDPSSAVIIADLLFVSVLFFFFLCSFAKWRITRVYVICHLTLGYFLYFFFVADYLGKQCRCAYYNMPSDTTTGFRAFQCLSRRCLSVSLWFVSVVSVF